MKDVKDAREMARVKGFERQFQILFTNSSMKTCENNIIYHFSTVVDSSSEKYSGSPGHSYTFHKLVKTSLKNKIAQQFGI